MPLTPFPIEKTHPQSQYLDPYDVDLYFVGGNLQFLRPDFFPFLLMKGNQFLQNYKEWKLKLLFYITDDASLLGSHQKTEVELTPIWLLCWFLSNIIYKWYYEYSPNRKVDLHRTVLWWTLIERGEVSYIFLLIRPYLSIICFKWQT